MPPHLEIHVANLALVDAEGLVVAVDGALCLLSGAAFSAVRGAFSADEEQDVREFFEEKVLELKPLRNGQAQVVEVDEKWRYLVVTAALLHSTAGNVYASDQHQAAIQRGVASAVRAAGQAGLASISMSLIGAAARLTVPQAVSATCRAIAACGASSAVVRWCFLSAEDAAVALAEARRIGLHAELFA